MHMYNVHETVDKWCIPVLKYQMATDNLITLVILKTDKNNTNRILEKCLFCTIIIIVKIKAVLKKLLNA